MQRGFLHHMRAAGLVLALAALVFKAMLPPGFMLDLGGDRPALTLCSGVTLDPGHDAPKGDASQHCPFALANAPALEAPPVPALAPAHVATISITTSPRALALAVDATGPPLPARGPPLQA